MSVNLLIIDDEKPIRDMITTGLSGCNYELHCAQSVVEAKKILAEYRIDLILLDWMLPNINGINFVKQIREQHDYAHLGVIMLTAKGDEDDIVRALNEGADDFISKPFSFDLLISRINAVLRRLSSKQSVGASDTSNTMSCGILFIDENKRQIKANHQKISCSPTEFELIRFFCTHTDRIYSRQELLTHVWGESTYIDERTVDVHIRRVRGLLEPHRCDHYIKTVRGAGYRFSVSD